MPINPASSNSHLASANLLQQTTQKSLAQKTDAQADQTADAPGHIRYDADTRRFIIDGKSMTLTELLFKVSTEAAVRAKEGLAVSVQSLQDANGDAKAAVEWLNKLRTLTPEGGPDSTVSAAQINRAKTEFQNEHGFDPFKKYSLDDLAKSSGTYKQTEMEKLTEGTKSYMGTVNNNQQAIQLDVERYTHVVTEANQLFASVGKSIHDTLSSNISKI